MQREGEKRDIKAKNANESQNKSLEFQCLLLCYVPRSRVFLYRNGIVYAVLCNGQTKKIKKYVQKFFVANSLPRIVYKMQYNAVRAGIVRTALRLIRFYLYNITRFYDWSVCNTISIADVGY
jgi:hypothetical protein